MRRGPFVIAGLLVVLGVIAGWQPLNAWAGTVAGQLVSREPQVVNREQLSGQSQQQAVGDIADHSQTAQLTTEEPDSRDQKTVGVGEHVYQPVRTPAPTGTAAEPAAPTAAPGSSAGQVTPAAYRYQLTAGGQTYSLASAAQLSVLQLMQQLASQGFTYAAKEYDYGVFITGINGVANNPATQMYWTYTVNGQSASVGADQHKLGDGDVVVWIYGKS